MAPELTDGGPGRSSAVDDAGLGRVLTAPNVITTVRLLCIPVFLWLLLRPHHRGWYPAALLLAVLGATDGVDGFVARRFHQVSTVGKVLDPLADRLLIGVAGISIIAVGAVPLWVGVTALAREVLVAVGFVLVAALGARRMDVSWAGKAATFAVMCALPLFLAGHARDDWHTVAEVLAWVSALPGLVVGWYAVATYAPTAVAEVRSARRGGGPDTGDREASQTGRTGQ
jgi:cardiolipin synthase